MRRRRYLQAVALGASGLAGCNTLDQGTNTPTTTPTQTESPTPTPREEAPSVDPPAYMDLLPKPHLKGTDETSNANFARVDWDWYLSHYDTEMQFGVTSEEDWTLEANAGNLNDTPPPKYRLLHTPVGTYHSSGQCHRERYSGVPESGSGVGPAVWFRDGEQERTGGVSSGLCL